MKASRWPSQRPSVYTADGGPWPRWFRLLGLLFLLVVVADLFVRRGVVVGVVALAVYGTIMSLGLLAPGRLKLWSRRHPVLNSPVFGMLLFLSLVFLAFTAVTRLSTVLCLVLAVPVALALALAGLILIRRLAARRRSSSDDA